MIKDLETSLYNHTTHSQLTNFITMPSIIRPQDEAFANYHSLMNLPLVRALQEENEMLRHENQRLRNLLLTTLEREIGTVPEVHYRPVQFDGRISERLFSKNKKEKKQTKDKKVKRQF